MLPPPCHHPPTWAVALCCSSRVISNWVLRTRTTHLLQSSHRVPAVGHPGGEVGRSRRFIILICLCDKLRNCDLVRHGWSPKRTPNLTSCPVLNPIEWSHRWAPRGKRAIPGFVCDLPRRLFPKQPGAGAPLGAAPQGESSADQQATHSPWGSPPHPRGSVGREQPPTRRRIPYPDFVC